MGRPKYRQTSLHGIFVVDKPLGWTSMDVVRRVRDAAGFAKTGHAGTLDPLATGVIVCCIGKATRFVEPIMKGTKIYEASVDLTAFTNTDDREGEREEVTVDTLPTEDQVTTALKSFVGEIEQRPPAFSAVHIDGKRAYKRARQGEVVDIPARTVVVHAISLTDYVWPIVKINVTCGKGVYVRSLARDLGRALNTGGHLAALRRTAVGEYTLDDAHTAERLMSPISHGDVLPIPIPGETRSSFDEGLV